MTSANESDYARELITLLSDATTGYVNAMVQYEQGDRHVNVDAAWTKWDKVRQQLSQYVAALEGEVRPVRLSLIRSFLE